MPMKYIRYTSEEIDIRILNSVFIDYFVEGAGSVFNNSKNISINILGSLFLNCSSTTIGGVFYSEVTNECNIESCCFDKCYSTTSSSAAFYISGKRQDLFQCSFYSCGIGTTIIVCFFSGTTSSISFNNFSKSNMRYSISSYTVYCINPIVSYETVAFGRSSHGIALHANSCENAIYEYVSVVNNTDQKILYGIMHFHGTITYLSHVIIMHNINFSFASTQTTMVYTSECYSDSNTNFGFKIDLTRSLNDDMFLTAACARTVGNSTGLKKEFLLIYIMVISFP